MNKQLCTRASNQTEWKKLYGGEKRERERARARARAGRKIDKSLLYLNRSISIAKAQVEV